jgi:hypothetical protein
MIGFVFLPILLLDYKTSRNITLNDFPALSEASNRIFVFAHHSEMLLDDFDMELLKSVKNLGFYTVVVTNLNMNHNETIDLVLEKGSRGRDLGVLRDFARISDKSTFQSIEILFCNNSMIWHVGKFEELVASLSNYPADTFVFPSDSNNPTYHVQPYLLYINLSKCNYEKFQQSFEWIKNLRLKRSTVRFSEYPMSRKLSGIGWDQAVVAEYESVYKSFSKLHEGDGNLGKLKTSSLLNPTQEMWDGLILAGIPGIKRSLINHNPVGVINEPDSPKSAFHKLLENL